mgnify:CR=1 FL=1
MTLNQVLEIVKLSRYSQSLEKNQRIGDLNIINVLRVLRKEVI